MMKARKDIYISTTLHFLLVTIGSIEVLISIIKYKYINGS